MSDPTRPGGRTEPLDPDGPFDPLAERIRAWWLGVLTGEPGQDHPVHGPALSARVNGDELLISGTMRSEEERGRVLEQAEYLRGRGVTNIRDELHVDQVEVGELGLLTQVLVSVFESESHARLAQQYLAVHPGIHPRQLSVVGDEDAAASLELPKEAMALLHEALDQGHAGLVAQVDEVEAFHARALLDEESRSLRTVVLPPMAAAQPDPGD